MFGKIKETLQSKIFYTAWLCLHIAYQVFILLRDYVRVNWKHVKSRMSSCLPMHNSQERELVNFIENTATLQKIPKHLAISVIPGGGESVLSVLLKKLTGKYRPEPEVGETKKNEDYNSKEIFVKNQSRGNDEAIDFHTVARIVSWAYAANISVISLYDYYGVFKSRSKELGCYIQEEIVQDFWAVKRCRGLETPPVVKVHNNVPKTNGYTNGVNGIKPHETIHIFLYSRNDGKPVLVQAVRDICSEKGKAELSLENSQSGRIVDEKKLDSYLNRYYCWNTSKTDVKTEPDLLVVLGNVKSTLGFLPWHIRLTEIHWLPPLNRLELLDFQESLFKYSGCQQRIGT